MVWLIAAMGVVACHPDISDVREPNEPLVNDGGGWSNGCGSCVLFDASAPNRGTCGGDLCTQWERVSPELVLFDGKTVQVDVDVSSGALDLYWDTDAGVTHMTLTQGCP